MIRFAFGFMSLILTVGGIEGSASLSLIITTLAVGITLMLWGIIGMNKKGQLA
tara:strand:+ start:32 stop:190 length:159 start_codon:yes stop_codon:yes gene_type:complete